ncbi:hypothetical protein PV664_36760 [Streptomyces sp. ME01-18a]|uniref:sodium:solute symporter family protein n=1 Tax=Streptomyces sp. ME01-18a TaxID=3028669 RepID=UPI0029A70FAD|nr:hypothetical protein [Streptomyces sp. ME01-18a]MDX3434376.1 hypothetical protein [Streptomyces sp. ME01-18a]
MIRTISVSYIALQLAIGLLVYWRQRSRTSDDYVVARGSMGMLVLGGTLAATQLSSGVALGDVAWTSAYGIGYYFIVWPFLWLGYWLSAKWVARKMLAFGNSSGATTIPDVLAARYDSQRLVRFSSALIIVLAFTFSFSVQIRAAAHVLGTLFGISSGWAIIVTIVVSLIYTSIGGLRGIAYNDLLHIGLFVVTFGIGAVLAVQSAGGVEQVTSNLQAQDASLLNLSGSHGLGFWALIGLGLSLTLQFICYPIDTMKFYSAKSRRHLLHGIGIGFIFQALVALAVITLGLAGRVLYPDWTVTQYDEIVPTLAMDKLPPVIGGLVIAVVLGAIMAVSSSIYLTAGSAIANDLYIPLTGRVLTEGNKLLATRLGVLVVAAAGAGLSVVDLGSMATVINNVVQVLAASFAVTMLFGLASRKPNRSGAILSMIGGAVGVTIWILIGRPWGLAPSFLGFALSIVGMAVGVCLGRPVSERHLSLFFPEVFKNPSPEQTGHQRQ